MAPPICTDNNQKCNGLNLSSLNGTLLKVSKSMMKIRKGVKKDRCMKRGYPTMPVSMASGKVQFFRKRNRVASIVLWKIPVYLTRIFCLKDKEPFFTSKRMVSRRVKGSIPDGGRFVECFSDEPVFGRCISYNIIFT